MLKHTLRDVKSERRMRRGLHDGHPASIESVSCVFARKGSRDRQRDRLNGRINDLCNPLRIIPS